MTVPQFRTRVWEYYRRNGRHDLPWRKTRDPYRILVSEVMLQQTQVERVRPYYRDWLKQFPTAKALAAAPLSDVLKAWQGLGYNRRAKMLHAAGKVIAKEGFPKTTEGTQALPGVGPYTARAVMAFAYNADGAFLETNIRTAILHHFFPKTEEVHDREILKVVEDVLPKGRAREWYAALMDYGSALKRTGVRLNSKVMGYQKQSTFQGSTRQARGAILRALIDGPMPLKKVISILGDDREEQVVTQLSRLHREGIIELEGTKYRLAR